MQNLTPNERRHAESLDEIRNSSSLEAQCGSYEQLEESLEELLPLHDYNPEWRDVQFDEHLRDCSLRFADLGAQWQTTGAAPEIYGEFRILHFYDVLSQPDGPVPSAGATSFQTRFLSELRYFDQTPRSGAGMLTYMRMQPNVTPLEIWYHDIANIGVDPYPTRFVKLDITYCQYLDALLLTKGTYGWQYLYADVQLGGRGFYETANYLTGMLELFPEIFPRYDYSDLRARLEARL